MSRNKVDNMVELQQTINKPKNRMETKTSHRQTKVRSRWENREKMRNMVRLRKLIRDMNEMCDEHFMVTIAAPEVRKHVSFYGSRSLIRAAFTSRYRNELIKEMKPNKDVQYIPFMSMDPDPNEENMSDAELNMAVVRMMDLFNYPGKEHYSFKKKSCLDTKQPKPKPDFWPRQVRFTPLLSTDLAEVMESDTPVPLLQRREAFRIVLSHMREYYARLLRRLDSNDGRNGKYESNESRNLPLNDNPSPISRTSSLVEDSRENIDELEPIVVVNDMQMCNTLEKTETISSYSLGGDKSQLLVCQRLLANSNCTQQQQNTRCTSSVFPTDRLVSYNPCNPRKRIIPSYGSEEIAFHYQNISYEIREPKLTLNQLKNEYDEDVKHIKNYEFPEGVAHIEEVESKNDLVLVDPQGYDLMEKEVDEAETHSHMIFEDNIVENQLQNRFASTSTDMNIGDEYPVSMQTGVDRILDGSTHFARQGSQISPLSDNHMDTRALVRTVIIQRPHGPVRQKTVWRPAKKI